jgi:hypothetical protein
MLDRSGTVSMPSLIKISRLLQTRPWGGDRHIGTLRGEGSIRIVGDLSSVDADDGPRRFNNKC